MAPASAAAPTALRPSPGTQTALEARLNEAQAEIVALRATVTDLQARVNKLSYQQYTGRSHAQVMRFFTGLELVEPGLVQVHQWRPGAETDGTLALWAGVGRKPG